MFRLLGGLFLFAISISIVGASPQVSQRDMARDLSAILVSRANIATLSSTGATYVAFSRKYLQGLDEFTRKYITPFHVFALRPRVDRSLVYSLRVQQYSLSCEIAALQIILAALGTRVSENEIFAGIPQYPYIYASGGIWGDPDREFVGSYTGGQAKKTGYGIYEKPLADYARQFHLSTKIHNQLTYSGTMNPGAHMALLLQNLDVRNTHVLLWGDWCTDPQYEDGVLSKGGGWILELFPLPGRNYCDRFTDARTIKWTTPAGKNIVGLSGEHTFVLLGYVGTPKNPTHIIVWDTYTGRHVYSYSEWMRKWSRMQFRSLVISRPE